MTVAQFSSKRSIEENRTFVVNGQTVQYLGTADDGTHLFYNDKLKK